MVLDWEFELRGREEEIELLIELEWPAIWLGDSLFIFGISFFGIELAVTLYLFFWEILSVSIEGFSFGMEFVVFFFWIISLFSLLFSIVFEIVWP